VNVIKFLNIANIHAFYVRGKCILSYNDTAFFLHFFRFLLLQRNFYPLWLHRQTSATKLCYLQSSAFYRAQKNSWFHLMQTLRYCLFICKPFQSCLQVGQLKSYSISIRLVHSCVNNSGFYYACALCNIWLKLCLAKHIMGNTNNNSCAFPQTFGKCSLY